MKVDDPDAQSGGFIAGAPCFLREAPNVFSLPTRVPATSSAFSVPIAPSQSSWRRGLYQNANYSKACQSSTLWLRTEV